MPRHTHHPLLGMTTIVTEIRTTDQMWCHRTKVRTDRQDNQNVPVTVHAMRPEPDVHVQVNDDYLPPYVDYDNPDELEQGDPELTLYTQFYKAAVQLADNAERRDGRCHNCKEPGHFWCECQQPLREDFKCLMDCTCQCQEELNKNGGPRAKGGRAPQVGVAQPQPMMPVQVLAMAQQ